MQARTSASPIGDHRVGAVSRAARSLSRRAQLAADRYTRALDVVGRHPRHALLAALAVALALSGESPDRVLPLAVAGSALLLGAGRPRLALALGALFICGWMAGDARLEAIDASAGRLSPGDGVAGSAYLLAHPRPSRFGESAELRVASGRARGARLLARFEGRVRLPHGAQPGSELSIRGAIRRPRPPRKGGFDVGAYLRRRGVAGELAVAEFHATGRRRGGLAGAIDLARVHAERGISAGLEPGRAALARGMVLGEDDRIDPGVLDDFRASGLAHLLAVSGQNVMLMAALALPLLAAAGVPGRARLALTIALIAIYVPLAGAGPSLQRAGVMGAVSLLALGLSRPDSRWHALLLAACATLALNPRAVGDPGWQLSFAAVAGILALGPPLRTCALRALPRLLAEGVAVTSAATLATAPLLAHHFGAVSPAGLAANLLALPLVAPIMWLGMLRATVGQVMRSALLGPVAARANACLGTALGPLVGGLGLLARSFSEMPGARVRLPAFGTPLVLCAYAAIGLMALGMTRLVRRAEPRLSGWVAGWRRRPRGHRMAAVACGISVVALLASRLTATPPWPGEPTVSFLDVGQGDATLIQHPDGTAVLFDGGPPEGRAARLLRRAGVRRLTVLVMTHPSRDHHGGLREVVERFPVDLLVDGGDGTRDPSFRAVASLAAARGARRVAGIAPTTLHAGGITIRLLSPHRRAPGPAPEDPNPRAIVAVVSIEDFDLLLSADAESPSLLGLPLQRVEAMKVPHHGSRDEGLPAVLRRVRPRVAAVPVGENTYGHPAPSTLVALRRAGVRTFRTDRQGTVRVTLHDGALRVAVERGDVEGGS